MLAKDAVLTLLDELFLGMPKGQRYTWVVEGREAILPTLESLTAEEASVRIEGRPSIGAHAVHAAYYLETFNRRANGESFRADWEGSWAVQSFDNASWVAAQANVRQQYLTAREILAAGAIGEDERHDLGALTNIAHAAFHLGAIRALVGRPA